MNVLFLPDYRKTNPYQTSLAEALSRHGVHVAFGRTRSVFSSIRSYWHVGNVSVLHLHWPEALIADHRPWLRAVKAIILFVELLGLRVLGVKIVWTMHNIHGHESARTSAGDRILSYISRTVYDGVIAHCDSVLQGWQRTARSTARTAAIIPHGHYIGRYLNTVSRAEARKRFDLGRKDVVYLFLGQVREYKGVEELLRVFTELDLSDARLIVAGKPLDESYASRLRVAFKSDKIHFDLRYIPDEEIQFFLNAADFVVLPYRDIATSGSAILAMSFSRPVVAPAIGCVNELISKGGGGIPYDPQEPDALRKALKKAYRADAPTIGQRGFLRVQHDDWEAIAVRTRLFYGHVTGVGAHPQ